MTEIIEGMTPAEFLTAINGNFTELATTYDIYINSFVTITNLMTPTEQRNALNHNLRATAVNFGQRGGSFIANLNTYFNTPFPRFQDRKVIPIALGAEPSAIVSTDGNTLDIWTSWRYFSTTDCITFTEPVSCVFTGAVSEDHGLGRVFKDGETYYMLRSLFDIDEGGYYKLILFTTTDKIHWTFVCDIIEPGNYGTNWNLTNPCNSFCWNENGTYYIIYEASLANAGPLYRIGLATAPALTGPWTNYAGNPIIPYDSALIAPSGDGRPVLVTDENNQVLKVNGKYFIYYHHEICGAGMSIRRAYSTDLHNWTVEGNIVDQKARPEAAGTSNGDIGICQFKGKSYMFYSNNVNGDSDPPEKIGMVVDNRPFAELLAIYP